MQPVFIVGTGRNGTTMLGAMLGAHPNHVTVPECQFKEILLKLNGHNAGMVLPDTAFDAIENDITFRLWGIHSGREEYKSRYGLAPAKNVMEWLVRRYASGRCAKLDICVWIDHDPLSFLYMDKILEVFPDARFVHIIRDGRAVAASVMPLDWGANTIIHAAYYWKKYVSMALDLEKKYGADRMMRVYYEDVVRFPARTLKSICDWLGIGYRDSMIEGKGFILPAYTKAQHGLVGKPPETARTDDWKNYLKHRQIEIFEAIAGKLLADMGYSLLFGDCPRQPGIFERIWAKYYEKFRKMENERKIRLRQEMGIKAARVDIGKTA